MDIATVTWTVTTYTSGDGDAGSDANGTLKIYGKKDGADLETAVLALANDGSQLKSGQTDEFSVQSDDIGTPYKILIGQDGTGDKPSWKLDLVEIQDSNGNSYSFTVNAWLAADQDDGSTEREITLDVPTLPAPIVPAPAPTRLSVKPTTITAHNDAVYKYSDVGLALSFQTSVVFEVKIANDATISLTTFKNNFAAPLYEIAIGAWSNGVSFIGAYVWCWESLPGERSEHPCRPLAAAPKSGSDCDNSDDC